MPNTVSLWISEQCSTCFILRAVLLEFDENLVICIFSTSHLQSQPYFGTYCLALCTGAFLNEEVQLPDPDKDMPAGASTALHAKRTM
jgi:hypothetical protein